MRESESYLLTFENEKKKIDMFANNIKWLLNWILKKVKHVYYK